MRASSNTWQGYGLALVFGGALSLITVFQAVTLVGSLTSLPYLCLAILVPFTGVLVLMGLIGLHRGQAARAGILGKVGFATAFLGALATLVAVCSASIEAVATWDAAESYGADGPSLMRHGSILWFAILFLGLTVLGVSMFKAEVYPRGATVMLIIGSVLLILVEVLFVIVPTALVAIPAGVVVGTIMIVTALFRLAFEISSGLLYKFWKWLPKPHSRHRRRHEG